MKILKWGAAVVGAAAVLIACAGKTPKYEGSYDALRMRDGRPVFLKEWDGGVHSHVNPGIVDVEQLRAINRRVPWTACDSRILQVLCDIQPDGGISNCARQVDGGFPDETYAFLSTELRKVHGLPALIDGAPVQAQFPLRFGSPIDDRWLPDGGCVSGDGGVASVRPPQIDVSDTADAGCTEVIDSGLPPVADAGKSSPDAN